MISLFEPPSRLLCPCSPIPTGLHHQEMPWTVTNSFKRYVPPLPSPLWSCLVPFPLLLRLPLRPLHCIPIYREPRHRSLTIEKGPHENVRETHAAPLRG